MKEDSIVAIIPAAGIGSRFDGDVPKQYFNVNGSSIIESAPPSFGVTDLHLMSRTNKSTGSSGTN